MLIAQFVYINKFIQFIYTYIQCITLCFIAFSDLALDLVGNYEDLATACDDNQETALHALARMPIVNKRGFWQRCFNLR